jgi:opacity protein-like surface antigen|tara:strand:+ start:172 stop:570 length:399 start_codon:yes stop_codon:yes gene_type:complete
MKKMFLMASLILAANLCSAQFMAVTTINQPEDNAEWEMSNVTDNMGIGYMLKDNIAIGLVKNGEEYDVWGRYYFSNCYAVVQAPTEEATDNLNFGVGYSFKVWKELYVDPNYMMSMEEDSEGEFKIGVSYKF